MGGRGVKQLFLFFYTIFLTNYKGTSPTIHAPQHGEKRLPEKLITTA